MLACDVVRELKWCRKTQGCRRETVLLSRVTGSPGYAAEPGMGGVALLISRLCCGECGGRQSPCHLLDLASDFVSSRSRSSVMG